MGGDDRTAKLLRVSARLLAFDTSTEVLSVALHCDAGSFAWNGPGGAAASAQLLPQVRLLLREAGVELAQLQAIAFGRGPGAFTGLRTACAVAQGLAFGAALPVLPLDSLMIVAEGARVEHRDAPTEVDVVMDARMGEVYAGRYDWTGMQWRVRVAPALRSLDGLHAGWAVQPPRCVVGTALLAFGERLHWGDATRIGADIDRAAALLRLAQQRWVEEGGVDAAAALPLYLRDKVALTVAERDALRRAGAAS
jgi:tRNA threonylcarbamoyladenosine biosynthesis protein TsaB